MHTVFILAKSVDRTLVCNNYVWEKGDDVSKYGPVSLSSHCFIAPISLEAACCFRGNCVQVAVMTKGLHGAILTQSRPSTVDKISPRESLKFLFSLAPRNSIVGDPYDSSQIRIVGPENTT
jgi:hypothetical protein